MTTPSLNITNKTKWPIQTIGIEISPNSMLPNGSIMPDRFNTIGESNNYPTSSIGKIHHFIVGEIVSTPEMPLDNTEEQIVFFIR